MDQEELYRSWEVLQFSMRNISAYVQNPLVDLNFKQEDLHDLQAKIEAFESNFNALCLRTVVLIETSIKQREALS